MDELASHPTAPSRLITSAELPFGQSGRASGLRDVRVEDGRVIEVAARIEPRPGESVTDAAGAALLPGLHDHHLHLFALAAARASVDCSLARTPAQLAALFAAAVSSDRAGTPAMVRAIGYAESLAGDLDRYALDRLTGDLPVRVQHRSGALWVLNSAALRTLGLLHRYTPATAPHPSLELELGITGDHEDAGLPTGRVWRGDGWLRTLLPSSTPSLALVGRELAALGITGITDATPHLDGVALDALAEARLNGDLPQRVQLLHDARSAREHAADATHTSDVSIDVDLAAGTACSLGPLKIVLGDHSLPDFDELVASIRGARRTGRAVAVHSVTLDSLALLLAALDGAAPSATAGAAGGPATTGAPPGDRVEHAAVVPEALVAELVRLGLTVVTQPGFIAHRGDELGADLGTTGIADLYRVSSLLDAGVPLALSSDAPYGPLSPWEVIDAASRRIAPSGDAIGVSAPGARPRFDERIAPDRALARLLSPLDAPGAAARRVVPGADADLVLLRTRLDEALAQLPSNPVRATMVAGRWVHGE